MCIADCASPCPCVRPVCPQAAFAKAANDLGLEKDKARGYSCAFLRTRPSLSPSPLARICSSSHARTGELRRRLPRAARPRRSPQPSALVPALTPCVLAPCPLVLSAPVSQVLKMDSNAQHGWFLRLTKKEETQARLTRRRCCCFLAPSSPRRCGDVPLLCALD